MKRIVAKEFLLLVGCIIAVLLVTIFGLVRNSWFEHRYSSIGREHAQQAMILDSLSQRAVPMHLDFLDLFDLDFVRGNSDVFLVAPFWTMDPFLTSALHERVMPGTIVDAPVSDVPRQRRPLAEIADELIIRDQLVHTDTKPPFDPNEPFFIVEEDLFAEFGGEQVLPPPPSKMNRRYLMCIVKALEREKYLTVDRIHRLFANCGQPKDAIADIGQQLSAMKETRLGKWHPPANASEIYNRTAAKNEVTTWKDVLGERGVPKDEMTTHLSTARNDTSSSLPLLLSMRGFLCDTVPFNELRSAFDHLKERNVLRCNVDELLYTLQNKAVPPSQEALDALAKQRAVVDELGGKQNSARASLWSEAKQWAVVKWAAVVLLVLVYPLRLLVLGTLWAIKVLRK